jgi:hypothetical protein
MQLLQKVDKIMKKKIKKVEKTKEKRRDLGRGTG